MPLITTQALSSETTILNTNTMQDKRTCLYDRHVAQGAKMVSFGGFEMPLQYTDITDEHLAVRQA